MDLYFAFGTYQFFNVINLKLHEYKNEQADLLMTDCFPKAKVFYERAVESGLFENVWLLQASFIDEVFEKSLILSEPNDNFFRKLNNKLTRNFQKYILFATEKQYRSYPFYKKRYGRIFIAGMVQGLEYYLLYQIFKRKSKLFIYEDGTAQLVPNSSFAISPSDRIKDFFGFKQVKQHISGMYLYAPEHISIKYHCPIIKQQPPSEIEAMKKIYHYDIKDDYLATHNGIYIGSGYSAYLSRSVFGNLGSIEKEIVEENSSILNQNNFIVKYHPSAKLTFEHVEDEIRDVLIPYEALGLFSKMDDKILIGISSTALYVPKFIYNQEPYLIFIHRLLFSNISDDLKKYIEYQEEYRVAEIIYDTIYRGYHNKNKIFAPETKEEFKKILEDIL